MPESDDQFLGAVVAWHEGNLGYLAGAHVQSRLLGPTTGRRKNAVSLEFISTHSLVSVTVWDSGECEAITTAAQDGEQDPAVSVLELTDPHGVAGVLNRVGAALATG